MQRNVLTTDDLVFVGFNGKVFAVNLHTGDRVWRWQAQSAARAAAQAAAAAVVASTAATSAASS